MADTKYPVGRYRLTQRSYVPRVPGAMCEVLDEGAEISFDGAPGAHMEPVDDDARAAIALAERERRLGSLDPTASLSLTQSPDTQNAVLVDRVEALRDEIERLHAENARLRGDVAAPAPALVLAGAPAPVSAASGPDAPPQAVAMPPAPPAPPAPPPLPGR